MSVRLVYRWGRATQVVGALVMACNTSPSLGGGPSGGGGSAGAQGGAAGQGGGGCADASAEGCQAVGGSAGSGGTGGSGGTAGSSGAAGSGGSGGSGGASQLPDLGYEPAGMGDPWFFTLQSDWSDYFKLDKEHGASAEATWNAAGEVHVSANFAASGDNVKLHVTAPYDSVASANQPFDLSQRMLRARVRVAPGASAPGGLQLYSQSTSAWSWKNGEWLSFTTLAGAEFQEVEFDLAESTEPTQVIRIGMQLYGTGAGSVTFILDDLRLEPKAPPQEADAGSDPGDAGSSASDAGLLDGDAGAPSPDSGLGYTPLGLGDPWRFTDSAEADDFATTENATKTWEAPGQLRVTGDVTVAEGGPRTLQLSFTTPSYTPTDMSGRILRARVKLDPTSTATGHVEAFAQSTDGNSWPFATGASVNSLADFTDVALALDAPAAGSLDATAVFKLGLQFYAYTTGTVHLLVDDFRLEPAD